MLLLQPARYSSTLLSIISLQSRYNPSEGLPLGEPIYMSGLRLIASRPFKTLMLFAVYSAIIFINFEYTYI